jgi:hypothetical protein
MTRGTSQKMLMREMKHYFPPRWRVSEVATRMAGNEVHGTIKIRCITDSKTFLSDFDAVIGPDCKIKEFHLDGVKLTGKVACPGAEPSS